MKTTKLVTILLALVLLTAPTARSAEKLAEKQISNTRTASCLVKVTIDPSVLPGGIIAIDYLMHSSSVAGKAAREVLDVSPDIASELIEVEEIESIFTDSAGLGMPSDYRPWASTYGTTTTSHSTRPTSPTTARTPSRTTTAPTMSSAKPTTPRPAAVRPPTRRTPIPTAPRRTPTVTQPLPSTTEQTILFHLRVDFSEYEVDADEPVKYAAEEFMMALIDNFRSALRGAFDEYKTKFNQQLDHAREEADHAERELVQMQAKLRDISGSYDLSRNVILRNISGLRQKLQTNMMDMTSYKSTIEATTKRIAETKAQIKEKLSYDTVAHELQKIIDINAEQVRRLESKGPHEPETVEARENLAKARVELAKRREELSKSEGGNLISTLNEVLADASMQENEAMGQIKNLQKQIAEAETLLSRADDYELLSLKADIARQNLEETLLWRARLGRNIHSIQPPDVTVIGAAD